jgi:polyhydroxybutyrate depolymerase
MKTISTLFISIIYIGFTTNISAQCNDVELIIVTNTGEWAEEMSWNLYNENNLIGSFQGIDGSDYTEYTTSFCLETGCYFIEALDSWGDGWNGGEIILSFDNNNSTYSLSGNTFIGYQEFELGQNTGGCEVSIYGCQDNQALNYNESATINNESCVYLEEFYVSGEGNPREYIFYKPPNALSDAPLVFVSHGYSGSAEEIMNYSGFIELADINGFALCFPQGQLDGGDMYFNVGYNVTPNNATNEVQFFTELASYLQETYNLSSENTFSTGMSNGADLSYLLACEASETFSAIAGVAGTMFNNIINNCSAIEHVSIMEIHGTQDNVTYYNGDLNDTFWGPYPSQEDVIDFWVSNNDCQLIESSYLPNISTNDGSEILLNKYSSSSTSTHIWFYKVEGGGHDWPGAWGNMDIDSAEEIWKFFQICIDDDLAGCTDEYALNFNTGATVDDASCLYEDSSECENIRISLINGWNMIGFSCTENTDAVIAFSSIQENIIIVKDGSGNAYLPDWDFNGIGELERGYGYLIKVSQEINDYNICD